MRVFRHFTGVLTPSRDVFGAPLRIGQHVYDMIATRQCIARIRVVYQYGRIESNNANVTQLTCCLFTDR